MALQNKTSQWRKLLKKIGENLRTGEVEGLMFVQNIPGTVSTRLTGLK